MGKNTDPELQPPTVSPVIPKSKKFRGTVPISDLALGGKNRLGSKVVSVQLVSSNPNFALQEAAASAWVPKCFFYVFALAFFLHVF